MAKRHSKATRSVLRTIFLGGSIALALDGVAVGSATLTTLAHFPAGEWPALGGVISDDLGDLYGTTREGGSSHMGSVFRLARGSSQITTLVSFSGANGSRPFAGLTMNSSGSLFGTTVEGGSNNLGTVFRLDPGATSVVSLASFSEAAGKYPMAKVVLDRDGALYGTTSLGGLAGGGGQGTIFKVLPNSSQVQTLARFLSYNGQEPHGAVHVAQDGSLYTTSSRSGPQLQGTLSKWLAGTDQLQTLVAFFGLNGQRPEGDLAADTNGNLYGTTTLGGTYGRGSVFRYRVESGEFTSLYSFEDLDGTNPRYGLLIDTVGNLFGTTGSGGPGNRGTAFRIDAMTGQLSTIATFGGANGQTPISPLIADPDGNLYGTTGGGGVNGAGTIYRISSAGFVVPEPGSAFVLLSSFTLSRRKRRD